MDKNVSARNLYVEGSKLHFQLLEGKQIKDTIDLLKYVMLSRTPPSDFLISPLLGGSEN